MVDRSKRGLSAATSDRRGTLRGCPEVSPFRVTPILRQTFSSRGPGGTPFASAKGEGEVRVKEARRGTREWKFRLAPPHGFCAGRWKQKRKDAPYCCMAHD